MVLGNPNNCAPDSWNSNQSWQSWSEDVVQATPAVGSNDCQVSSSESPQDKKRTHNLDWPPFSSPQKALQVQGGAKQKFCNVSLPPGNKKMQQRSHKLYWRSQYPSFNCSCCIFHSKYKEHWKWTKDNTLWRFNPNPFFRSVRHLTTQFGRESLFGGTSYGLIGSR